ncbi:MAG: phosphopentomutase [Lachnospiraceae bacterium]|jgi:phosphopentomutase
MIGNMDKKKRVFLIVLDSFGIGEAPDAAEYGDAGSNTLRSVASSKFFRVPNLSKLGLFNIDGVSFLPSEASPSASYARLEELSKGKDTILGHWEIAGLVSPKPMPVFPEGFPESFIRELESRIGRKCLVNRPYSGTSVLSDYGIEHMKTGNPIVYTSADSVFQIAAHEEVIPVDELYSICRTARELLSGDLAVGRVIARPFVGDSPLNFKRTGNREDFALSPFAPTMLDKLKDKGRDVIGIGKIGDIFNHTGLTESTHTGSNDEGMKLTLETSKRDFSGLCFTNLVDTDSVYGHRRDIDGYAEAISRFDSFLTDLLQNINSDDALIITADHGCDPGYTKTTDHTREYVPCLIYSPSEPSENLGTIKGFTFIADRILEMLL